MKLSILRWLTLYSLWLTELIIKEHISFYTFQKWWNVSSPIITHAISHQNVFNILYLPSSFHLWLFLRLKRYCSSKDNPPDAPTTCCMSGCANCVWLDHAEDLLKYYDQKGLPKDQVLKEIESQVSDPMIKAFVLLEIKSRVLK